MVIQYFIPFLIQVKLKDGQECGCTRSDTATTATDTGDEGEGEGLNGGKTREGSVGVDGALSCVSPPKTRLHISTKQEILRGRKKINFMLPRKSLWKSF